MFGVAFPDGKPILMRDGTPFQYSTKQLAMIGRRVLAKHLKRQLVVTEPES